MQITGIIWPPTSSTWHSIRRWQIPVGGEKALLTEGAVQLGFGNALIKVILIQGDISPAQLGIRLFYPKDIVERRRMADLQKAVQCAAAIFLQKLLDVLSVLGGTPPFQKAQKRFIANRAQGRELDSFQIHHIAEFILLGRELQKRCVLVQQNPVHLGPLLPVFHHTLEPVLFLPFSVCKREHSPFSAPAGVETIDLLVSNKYSLREEVRKAYSFWKCSP